MDNSPESAWALRPCRPATLQINPLEDGCVVYQPEQESVHFLNQAAAMVLELCDGQHSYTDIEAEVSAHFVGHKGGRNLTGEILERFSVQGLILPDTKPPPRPLKSTSIC